MRNRTIGIILGVLAVFIVVVFALSIATLIKLQGITNKPAVADVPMDSTTTRAGTTGGTGTAGTGTTGTAGTGTTGTGTTGTPTSAPKNYGFSSMAFTDDNCKWSQAYANPWSSDYSALSKSYTEAIAEALQKSERAGYNDAEISISGFSGQYLDTGASAGTRVRFVIGIDRYLNSSVIEDDLETGALAAGFVWRDIEAHSGDLPPLPEAGQSAGWRFAADMFLTSINTSVDPCQDFFRYSCDNYIATHPLGDDPRQSTFDVLQNQIYANLTKTLANAKIDKLNSTTLQIVANMYKACVSVTNTTFQGPQLLLNIAQEYGGWPILSSSSSWSPDSVPNGIYWAMGDMFTKYGIATLFVPSVQVNWADVTANQILFMDQANLVTPGDYYRSSNLTEDAQNALRNAIYKTVQLLSTGTIDNKTVLPQIDRMVAIEVHLASISVNSTMQRNMSLGYNPYTIGSAASEFAEFHWDEFFNGSLHTIFGTKYGQYLNPFILVEPHIYVENLNTYLKSVNKDKDAMKDLVNYLIFRLVTPFLSFAGPQSSDVTSELRRISAPKYGGGLGGNEFGRGRKRNAGVIDSPGGQSNWLRFDNTDGDMTDQQSQCVANLVQYIQWGAGRFYVDEYFPEENRDDIAVVTNNILSAFSSTLSGLRWMDNPSALKAFSKVSGLVRNFAYPDFEQDNKELDTYYAWLIQNAKDINPDQTGAYYQYVRVVTTLQAQLMWQYLALPGDRDYFLMSPAIVNAWYQPERNSITFPAGILNAPFYRYDFPQAVNYGAIGVVMGHELSHGFDDQGVQFDWDGTLRTWMTPDAQTGFDQMAQCVVDEYDGFCYPQACINGIATQGENIGDNGGLKAAYRAYQAYVAAHGQEAPLPGMETYSMEQIFFLSFGQVWCGSYSDDALTKQLLTNPHSPGKDRVIGAVQNFPKFAEAFKCKKGDPMYPVSSCDVW